MSATTSIFAAAVALIAAAVAPAAAQSSLHAQWCMGGADVSPELQISGCTAVIESGRGGRADLATAYGNRGQAHTRKNDYDRAVADYTRAIEIDPRADAYFGRGFAYHRKRQYDLAIKDYDQALKLDPGHFGAKRNRDSVTRLVRVMGKLQAGKIVKRGDALFDAKKYDEAIREYDEAIKVDPSNDLSFYKRGRAYHKKGDLDRAMADFDQAVKLDPKSGLALSGRSEIWATKGDFVRAAGDLKASIALQEQIDGLDYLTLSEYYVKLKQYEPALAAIKAAYKIEGDDGYPVRYETGSILQRLGRHREAVREFTAAIRRFPKDALPYYGRGISYEKLGDKKKALQDFKRFSAQAQAKHWDQAGDMPGEAKAKLATYGLR